jgi:hypothetical protein
MSSSTHSLVQPSVSATRVAFLLGRVVIVTAALSGLVGVWFLAGVLSEMESAGPAHTGLVPMKMSLPMPTAMAAVPSKAGAPFHTAAAAATSVPDASAALAGRQFLAEESAPTF